MEAEWQETTIGDQVDLATGEAFESARFGTTPDSGTLLARGDNIKEGEFEWGDKARYWPELTPNLERRLLRDGDVLLGMDGSKVGKNWVQVREKDLPCLLVQRVACLRAKKSMDQQFLRYLIGNPDFAAYVERVKTGTSIPHISGGQIKAYQILLPSRAEQRTIAHILGSLDDKIELNRRMNETLEAMARALFKSWFIDFGPVRAKTAGRDPDLPADIAALFPDSFQDSELGPIPRGWKARSLRDVLTESNERVGDAEVPEYSSTNTGLELRSDHFKKKLAASSAKNKLIRSGDLVFGLSRRILNFGLMRDDIGSVSTAYKVFAVDQHEITPDLLQQMMRERPSYFYNAISGSTREGQSVSSEGLGQLKFTQPPAGLQRTFYGAVGPLSVLTTTLVKESMTIATLRDTLLPKLFSGELRANDVKSVMEGG